MVKGIYPLHIKIKIRRLIAMIERCCAFTGHRPKKFPWGYNEADAKCVVLKQALATEITKLVKAEYTDFFSGMAEGTDAWAALMVLTLKKEKPALKFHCVLPCEGQTSGRLRRGNFIFRFWSKRTRSCM